jgi:hypothetical protein
MGKKSRSGPGSESGMNILYHISESFELIFWVKNPLSGSGIRNLFDPGSGIREGKILIRNPG